MTILQKWMRRQVLAGVLLGLPFCALAGNTDRPLNRHEVAWRRFASQLVDLHRLRIKTIPVVKESRLGGYAHQPAFFREETYFTTDTHRLISRVRWETAHPDKLHTIEIYFYDELGRVQRDYTAAYLPNYYRAPSQTLISFHAYHGKLHAFRTFDADGFTVDEGCRGQYQGKQVVISLDEGEIDDGAPEMQTAAYRACFAGLRQKPGKYLTPQ